MTTAEKLAVISAIQLRLGITLPVENVDRTSNADQIIPSPAMRLREREQSETRDWELESSVWDGHTIVS